MDCEIPEVVAFLKSDCETSKDICIAGEVSSLNKCSVENYDLKISGARNKLMEDKADSGASYDIADAYSSNKIVCGRQVLASQPMNNFSCSQVFHSSDVRDEPKPVQDPSTEANLADSSFCSKEEYENSSNQIEAKARMVRTGHGSDSLLSVILREKSKENAEAKNVRENADHVTKGSAAAPFSRQSTAGFPDNGSPSFSSASPPSGLLAFSGSIPYSGSISQRSNSTTSTRSFAFPITTTEWYESPVRMAEADRGHLKKPRCWGFCFNCCVI